MSDNFVKKKNAVLLKRTIKKIIFFKFWTKQKTMPYLQCPIYKMYVSGVLRMCLKLQFKIYNRSKNMLFHVFF